MRKMLLPEKLANFALRPPVVSCVVMWLAVTGAVAADATTRLVPSSPQDGPGDPNLPPFARVSDIQVSLGARSTVLLAWTREVVRERVEWDEGTQKWQVRAAADPNTAMQHAPTPTQLLRKLPNRSPECDLLGQRTVLCRSLEPGGCPAIAVGSHTDAMLADYFVCRGRGGEWQIAFVATDLNDKVAPRLAVYSTDGCHAAKPCFHVAESEPSRLIATVADGSGLRAFVLQTYARTIVPDFMGGEEGVRLEEWYLETSGAVKKKAVYDRPAGVFERDHTIITGPRDRVSCFVRRMGQSARHGDDTPDELWHVYSDGGKVSMRQVAKLDADSAFRVVPVGPVCMVCVWLEDGPCDRGVAPASESRLMSASWDGSSWSKPKEVLRGEQVRSESLAACAYGAAGNLRIIVGWANREGRLAYTTAAEDVWDKPQTSDVMSGELLWLAPDEQGVVAITRLRDNLYWQKCRLMGGAD